MTRGKNFLFLSREAALNMLDEMETIVKEEIDNSLVMKSLCEKDSRLGFHSEAEGYKFFPYKLEWRAGLLRELLEKDFVAVRNDIKAGKELFAEYTGVRPTGKIYSCGKTEDASVVEKFEDSGSTWRAWHDDKKLYFEIKWQVGDNPREMLSLDIEPRRLWPFLRFQMSRKGK
jgi:hypothetical protein